MSASQNVHVVGDKLRQVRDSLCWSQEVAGNRSGYSTRLIRKLEAGGPVRRSTLLDVVAAYNEGIADSPELGLKSVAIDDFLSHNRDREAVVREWFDRVFNHRDITAVEDLVAPNVTLIADGEILIGRDPVRARIEAILSGFNPLRHVIEDIVDDGAKLVVYWNVTAVHSGHFFDIAPTNKETFIRGSTMAVIRDGVFIEARDHWDAKELMDQIL